MISIINVLRRDDPNINPISQVLTSLASSYILLSLALYTRSGKLVLSKKRFRRYLSKVLEPIRVTINNWVTHDLFEHLCARSIFCDKADKHGRVMVCVRNGVALYVSLILHVSAMFDIYRFSDSSPRSLFYIYASSIGLFLDRLCIKVLKNEGVDDIFDLSSSGVTVSIYDPVTVSGDLYDGEGEGNEHVS